MENERIYQTVITVHPTEIILCKQQCGGYRHSRQRATYKTNFTNNETKGKVSKAAAKKISRAIDYLIYTAKGSVIPTGFKGAGLKFKICFVTLTLPSKQVHSDKDIIQNILHPLLDYLRKHYHVTNYIWRAEKQKNENLHFHLLCDKFIPYFELRILWNRYLQNLGYVRFYKQNQMQWHKSGFVVRKKLLKTWSEEAQLAAYTKGLKEDWNNPNTTDIHCTKRIKNLKKYLCKYLTKSRNETINEEEINNKTVNDLLTITGRLWACSQSLSRIKGAKTDFDWDLSEEISNISRACKTHKVACDNYSIFFIHVEYLNRIQCPILVKLWNSYIKESFP